MSDATTALAEVLTAHQVYIGNMDYRCPCGGRFVDRGAAMSHQAGAVVAAVRGLSPDLQAELIGGEVQQRDSWPAWNIGDPVGTTVRVVGPWAPEPTEETA